jgi:hypothetical protein
MDKSYQEQRNLPTARDLLNMLQEIESRPEGDALLDKPVALEGCDCIELWDGSVNVASDSILLTRRDVTVAIKQDPVPVDLEVKRARDQGLLPLCAKAMAGRRRSPLWYSWP